MGVMGLFLILGNGGFISLTVVVPKLSLWT